MFKPQESKPDNPNHARWLRPRTVAAAVAAALALAACSSQDTEARPSRSPSLSPSPSASTKTMSPEQLQASIDAQQALEKGARIVAAKEYVESKNRDEAMLTTVNAVGARIAADAMKGKASKIGPFKFYNIQTKRWGHGENNHGWGYLQHKPQYGGSPADVSLLVYQYPDGTPDLERGIHDVSIDLNDGTSPALRITSPGEPGIRTSVDPWVSYKDGVWSTSLTEPDSLDVYGNREIRGVDPDSYREQSAAELIDLDNEVLLTFKNYAAELLGTAR
ncbi:MAG: hypothetical protein JWL85_788 [Candidatus Saccharibacteria bacterium]|nr:hypothetical protein [Candidatus Saccharibacteria bacterium]